MSDKPIHETITVLPKLYDFIQWCIQRISKFPRDQKFLIGDRMENLLFDILELVIEAVYTKQKATLLKRANLQLEKLRYYIRLCNDFHYISVKQYGFASQCVDEIGRMIGGWLKQAAEWWWCDKCFVPTGRVI